MLSFNIDNFRNLEHIQLSLDNKCNVFHGKNGSGKTSLLEAIYYMLLGRSFRSHILRRIVKYGSDEFSLFGKIQYDNQQISVGVTRSLAFGKRIKISGKEAGSNIEITKLLPLQLLNHDSYFFLYEGPKARRQFIDWGLFHVEQSFLSLWRKTERIIEQRNIAIRTKLSADCIRAWDKDLAQFGFELHQYRKHYIESFIPIATNILQQLLPNISIDISYLPGWNTNSDLESVLTNNLKQDLQFGYTSVGPQRADLQLSIKKIPVKDGLSRGQQKLTLYGMQIAQGMLLNNLTGKKCIYLIDDLLAELDFQKSKLLVNILSKLKNAQLFITGLNQKELKNVLSVNIGDAKIFHVDNGAIKR